MKIQSRLLHGLPFVILLISFAISGCAPYADLVPGSRREITSAVVSREEVAVATLPAEPPPSKDYQIGVGDLLLLLDVSGRSEFTIAVQGANGKTQGSGWTARGCCMCRWPVRSRLPV